MDIVDITRQSGNNDGGFKSILSYIPVDDIGNWPGAKANAATPADLVTMEAGDILAKVGKRWGSIAVHTERVGSSFSSEGNKGSLSIVRNPVITFDDLTDVEYGWLMANMNKPLVYILKDMADRFISYGSPELPAYMESFEGGNGTAIGDDKSMTCTIRAIGNPLFYAGNISYEVVV